MIVTLFFDNMTHRLKMKLCRPTLTCYFPYLLPVSCVRQKLLWWIAEEFRPTSATPGPGNSSTILLLLDTCGLRIALIHNGYHRTYLQRKKRETKRKKKNENFIPQRVFGISQHDPATPPTAPTITSENKASQKLFQQQTILPLHVSH